MNKLNVKAKLQEASGAGTATDSIKDLLSIFVITYNRQKPLKETLLSLKSSSWSDCRITVLDNCSTDETSSVVHELIDDFPDLHYIRNITNIGLAANAVQPFLMSRTPYTWVLCDDDKMDFTQVGDIEEALRSRQPTLALVGGHPEMQRRGAQELSTPKALLESGVNYYRDNSFLPSTIYCTDFARSHLSACYRFCYFNYPHVALALAATAESKLVYVSKNRLVTPTVGTQSYSSSEQLLWWYELAQTVKDTTERQRLLTSQWEGPLDPSGLYGLLNTAIRLKMYRIALILLISFNFRILVSLAYMTVARLRGVRHST